MKTFPCLYQFFPKTFVLNLLLQSAYLHLIEMQLHLKTDTVNTKTIIYTVDDAIC